MTDKSNQLARLVAGRTRTLALIALAVGLLWPVHLPAQSQTDSEQEFANFMEPDFPFITTTVDAEGLAPFMPAGNLTVRGLVLPLGNDTYACFDPDLLRMAVGWKGDFLSLMTMAQVSYEQALNKANGIPRVQGEPIFGTGIYPGWSGAAPAFADPRPPGPNPEDVGRGPIAQDLGQWNGVYVAGEHAVLSYSAHGTQIFEQPGSIAIGETVGVTRTFRTDTIETALTLTAADVSGAASSTSNGDVATIAHGGRDSVTAVGLSGAPAETQLQVVDDRYITLRLPEGMPAAQFRLVVWTGPTRHLARFRQMLDRPVEMAAFSDGGSPHWPRPAVTEGEVSPDTSAYVVDRLTLPLPNRWRRNVRPADIDFFDDGRAALVTFSGDVWLLSGIDRTLNGLRWKRFASGLYEPLSISVVDSAIYVYDRGGITRLHDLNGDEEADFYESMTNRVIQSTETREWPLDMVPRPGGGFYLSMGGALHGGPRTAPPIMKGFRAGSHHSGSVLEVSPEGDVEVFASGFREPYLGIHPKTGFLTASDQQGNFVPSTPIYGVQEDGYYGVPATAHREEPLPEPARPLTWIPHSVDPSGAGQVWITSRRMGDLNGALVHLSYGRPGPFRVYVDSAASVLQGGVVPLPGRYETPTTKGAVHPVDEQLYMTGFQIFGSSAERISDLVRLRYTGQASDLPTAMRAGRQGVIIRFPQRLAPAKATDEASYAVERWNYRRTEEYGSGHYTQGGAPGQEPLPVAGAHLSADQQAVLLVLPDMDTTMQMAIDYDLTSTDGNSLQNSLYLTVNELRDLDLVAAGFGDVDWQQVLRQRQARATDSRASEEPASVASARRGRHIYQEVGCVSCHALDAAAGGELGPTFGSLFGSERPLAAGDTVLADEDYIRQSILHPTRHVVRGYEEGMPSFEGVLREGEIESLILFIKSLSDGER